MEGIPKMNVRRGPKFTKKRPTAGWPSKGLFQFSFLKIKRAIEAAQATLGEGYELLPESICEGGVRMWSWPGMTGAGYKTMRIAVSDWPWDPESVEVDRLLTARNDDKYMDTVLKTSGAAPPWTQHELRVVTNALKNAMGDVRVSGLSTKRRRC
jgi:hypothetical protein